VSTDELGLGATIRAWRDRISPEAVGRPAGHGRRAPGLRREDLADLAGVSVDYVVRLEQGRAAHPSAQVVAALARALQLTVQERDHLYRLSGLQPPGPGVIGEHIPPGMQRVLARLGDAPTAVFAADWRLIRWNHAWAAALGDPSTVPPEERNFVRVRFPVPGEHARISAWPVDSTSQEATDRAVVADLRRASGRYPHDPRLAHLIRRSIDGNPRFARFWHEGAVGSHAEDRKTIRHPSVGDIDVDCDVLVDTATDLKIVVHTAHPGTEAASRLALATVTSTPADA
jgi:transcriptional regulator with XRE-family HTH domain